MNELGIRFLIMMENANGIRSALATLQWELYDLEYSSGIERRRGPLSGLEFLRDYVSRNKPVILTDCVHDWPALEKWSVEYLTESLGSKQLTIQMTPNGRADAICRDESGDFVECFVEPYEEQMTFQEFITLLNDQTASKIPYLQQQNDNLRMHYPELWNDVNIDGFNWASVAFDGKPEAVNLWIGDHRSVTSFHKDHYENVYVVLNGTKVFTLLPPCASNRLHFGQYLHAQYAPNNEGDLEPQISIPHRLIDWSPIELHQNGNTKALEKWHELCSDDFPPPLVCEVHRGEVLYLPSLWYHHVEQRNTTNEIITAVNFWYDMKFDAQYAYHKFVDAIARDT